MTMRKKLTKTRTRRLLKPVGSAWCNGGDLCSAKRKCGATEDFTGAGMVCTRGRGHKGEHIACGTTEHNYEVWPNDKVSDSRK